MCPELILMSNVDLISNSYYACFSYNVIKVYKSISDIDKFKL